MAISTTQIIPRLLKECPELQEHWNDQSARMTGALFFSYLSLHICNSCAEGDTKFFPRFFGFLEQVIIQGNLEVRALALDGFLKGLHKANSFSIRPGPEAFALWMRPETKRYWDQLSEAKAAGDRLKDTEEENARKQAIVFSLRPARLWGDYGSVLMSGSGTLDKESEHLLLERAGPFAPPIFFPLAHGSGRCAIVTESFRKLLENAGLGQLSFKPVIKHLIIDIPWHTWDRLAKFPRIMPKSGEPDNFVRGQKHSKKAAQEMEELWQLLPPGVPCEVKREQRSENSPRPSINRFLISPSCDIYRGLFSPSNNSHLWLVDEPTRLWFERHAGEWVQFDYVMSG